jgi:hypothetical protein
MSLFGSHALSCAAIVCRVRAENASFSGGGAPFLYPEIYKARKFAPAAKGLTAGARLNSH